MTKNKATIQDIAKELGLSRNTVSKALNDSPNLNQATKEKILSKAMEMNYKQFSYINSNRAHMKNSGNIVLLSSSNPLDPHFWSYVTKGIERKISEEGFNFSIRIIQPEELAQTSLPGNLNIKGIDGIICSEIFDKNYINAIINTNIPTVCIDSVSTISFSDLECDIVLMENEHSVFKLTTDLMKMGHTEIGFVGLPEYCRSFYERWLGFNRALDTFGNNKNSNYNIIPENDNYECDWIKNQLLKMEKLPTALVCANDYIAVNTLLSIKSLNLSIPDDISICGFDNSQLSLIVEPKLSTVHTYKEELGLLTAEALLWRLNNPGRPFQVTYMKTDVILRNSIRNITQNP